MNTSLMSEKIIVNFGWIGPSYWQEGLSHERLDVRVVDLLFKNAKTDISVYIPENISPTTVKKLPFACRRYHETECQLNGSTFKPLAQETHPDVLRVTVEQIRCLTIKVGIFREISHTAPTTMDTFGKIIRENRVFRSDKEITLELPEELKMDQTYNLIVTSHDFSLSARLLKEEKVNGTWKNEEACKDEFQRRMKKMGEAMITKGTQNLNLASKGGINSPCTTADVFAHGIQEVIRSGQQMHPGIKIPYSKPLETSSDLDKLDIEKLKSRYEATYEKDKELENQRMGAAIAGNMQEMNEIIEVEYANSQLLIELAEALRRRQEAQILWEMLNIW